MVMITVMCPAAVHAAEPQMTGASQIVVGDNVTATFDENTGTLAFCSNGGTLWTDWSRNFPAEFDYDSIVSIKAADSSGTIYLPEASDRLFFWLVGLTDADLRKFDTSKATDMFGMFAKCENLENVNLSSFDTSNVTDMSGMFFECRSLKKLDLSNFDFSKVTETENIEYMFYECTNLGILKTPLNVSLDADLPATMYDVSGNTYEKLPKSSKSIRLGLTEKLAYEFTDVADMSAWYYDTVYWAYANDVTSGMGEGTFQPLANLSRAQAVMFIYKMAERPDVKDLPDPGFSDVTSDDWFYDAVKWAVANKITSGYGTGTFQPKVTCNRAMIVTFLMRYSKLVKTYVVPAESANFSDVTAGDWFKDAVDWAVANGVTTGYGAGTFQPERNCNRAMMVTFLKRVADLSGNIVIR